MKKSYRSRAFVSGCGNLAAMEAPNALVVLAPGAEEMEVAIVVDILRRAGVATVLAGLDGTQAVVCSRGLQLVPDQALAEVRDAFAVVVLPGGAAGADRLAGAVNVGALLKVQLASGRLIAAICAAPIALQRHGVAQGRRVTSHPSVRASLETDYRWCPERVCEDGNLLTSQGPGTSFEFALAIVSRLCGPEKAAETRGPLRLD